MEKKAVFLQPRPLHSMAASPCAMPWKYQGTLVAGRTFLPVLVFELSLKASRCLNPRGCLRPRQATVPLRVGSIPGFARGAVWSGVGTFCLWSSISPFCRRLGWTRLISKSCWLRHLGALEPVNEGIQCELGAAGVGECVGSSLRGEGQGTGEAQPHAMLMERNPRAFPRRLLAF